MNLEIVPYKSVGPLHFNMARRRVREIFREYKFEEFQKSEDDPNTTDAYDKLGLHLFYDKKNKLEAMEAFKPAKLSFNGQNLLGQTYSDVFKKLKKIDPNCVDNRESGFESLKLGIASYNSVFTRKCKIESIIIFRKGYYD